MSLNIRLAQIGKKENNSYKIVVAERKSHRNGRAVEILGYFDDSHKNPSYLNRERFQYWVAVGAGVSAAVQKIADGKYRMSKVGVKTNKTDNESSA